ncbi:alkyl/aryl-sulfatase [Cupriavidus necator]|uniref:alkyl/aryl-sulfatase n=1 Tax=Cupriavidus necator TaxID=106590 RepID=UPI002785050B|nr:alkyl sulfatase dimerization domain-containing protein [Cupriavidus necator]MDQ0141814.1 alkyl sulfatase BDS1-like metallo-beta-lactamase superfamily hydrolase [Cupriavidus necator]
MASGPTRAAQLRALEDLPVEDGLDEEEASRGFIATVPDAEVRDDYGRLVWSLADYGFLKPEQAPDTAHPSLWRQARLNLHHGLFKVCDRIYQVRGFDLANMTIIEGDSGLIIIDPLTCSESAAVALNLYLEHRPRKPVVAVIYSHSHSDHFGGVKGVVSEADVRAGKVHVIAPAGFMEHAVSENVIAGPAMGRRAQFQFGHTLERNACCQIDSGLGKNVGRGTITLIPPTWLISQEAETHTIDGIEIVFQLTPESEAPAEMHFFFPQLRALNLAENATRTLHNLCPLRGAQVRNARLWSHYLDRALERYAPHADVAFAQHHWPAWGTERLSEYLAQQRDLYKYIHDQTVRLMNHGMTASEIAEILRLPDSLHRQWHARGYYGTLSHNVKAVYQHYLSWYDGNPANLHALPPEAAGAKYVEYMGGADAVVARARVDFERGEYRWVAQVMNHVVFAEPGHTEARELGAAAMEQMGFQAESATWRNAFLLGARELRIGAKAVEIKTARGSDMVRAMTDEMYFDYLAVRINGERAEGLQLRLDWVMTDTGRSYALNLENSALTVRNGRRPDAALATVSMERATLDAILLRKTDFHKALAEGRIRVDGDPQQFSALLGTLETFDHQFNVIEP